MLRNYLTIILSSLILVLATACTENESSVKIMLKKADKSFKSGDFERAAYLFHKLKNQYPETANLRISLGYSYLKLNWNRYAGGEFSKALKLSDQTNALAWVGLGIYYSRENDWNTAIVCFSKARLLSPNEPDIYRNLANSFYNNGEFSLAAYNYEHAMAISAPDVDLINAIGLSYEKNAKWDKAVKAYEKAYKLNNKNSDAIYRLAVIYRDQFNNLEQTKKYYSLLRKIDPKKAQTEQASFEFEIANNLPSNSTTKTPPTEVVVKDAPLISPPEKTAEELEQIKKMHETNRIEGLAKIALENNDYLNAVKKYLQLLKLDPTRGYVYKDLARIYENNLGDLNQAIKYYEDYLKWCNGQKDEEKFQTTVAYVNKLRDKYNAQELEKRNRILAEETRIKQERIDREKKAEEERLAKIAAAQKKPHSYSGLLSEGEAMLKKNKYAEARDYFQQAITINPDYPNAYLNIGLIEYKSTNYLSAIDYFNVALVKNPEFAKSHMALGATYNKLKQKSKVIEHYTYYLELAPDSKHAKLIQDWLAKNAGAE